MEIQHSTSSETSSASELQSFQHWANAKVQELVLHVSEVGATAARVDEMLLEVRDIASSLQRLDEFAIEHRRNAESQFRALTDLVQLLGGPEQLADLMRRHDELEKRFLAASSMLDELHTEIASRRQALLDEGGLFVQEARTHSASIAQATSRVNAWRQEVEGFRNDSQQNAVVVQQASDHLQKMFEVLGGSVGLHRLSDDVKVLVDSRTRVVSLMRGELDAMHNRLRRWQIGTVAGMSIVIIAGSVFSFSTRQWQLEAAVHRENQQGQLKSLRDEQLIQAASIEELDQGTGRLRALEDRVAEMNGAVGQAVSAGEVAEIYRRAGMDLYKTAQASRTKKPAYYRQKLQEARPFFEMAIRMAPEDPEPHFNLGVTLIELGAREQARERWGKVIALCPPEKQALAEQAQHLLKVTALNPSK